jgi:hypothetical protein
MISQHEKIIVIPLGLALIPGGEEDIIVIGILILEEAGRIHKPILKGCVPVWPYILRVHHFNDLFRATAQ